MPAGLNIVAAVLDPWLCDWSVANDASICLTNLCALLSLIPPRGIRQPRGTTCNLHAPAAAAAAFLPRTRFISSGGSENVPGPDDASSLPLRPTDFEPGGFGWSSYRASPVHGLEEHIAGQAPLLALLHHSGDEPAHAHDGKLWLPSWLVWIWEVGKGGGGGIGLFLPAPATS